MCEGRVGKDGGSGRCVERRERCRVLLNPLKNQDIKVNAKKSTFRCRRDTIIKIKK